MNCSRCLEKSASELLVSPAASRVRVTEHWLGKSDVTAH
jgi:hypothetical protein